MGKRHIQWAVAIGVLGLAAMPVYAADITLSDGLTNILLLVKALVSFVWNLRVILGLGTLCSGGYWYYRLSSSNEKVSLALPIVTVIAGALLTFSGALELVPELLTLESTNPITMNSDERANISSNATYNLTKGTSTTASN